MKVGIKGLNDNREVTALLRITPSGVYLPSQVVYQGTIVKCHPVCTFPDCWGIWHSSSHWSNEQTVNRFFDMVIVPYFKKERDTLWLPTTYKALLGVFTGDWVESVLVKLEQIISL